MFKKIPDYVTVGSSWASLANPALRPALSSAELSTSTRPRDQPQLCSPWSPQALGQRHRLRASSARHLGVIHQQQST